MGDPYLEGKTFIKIERMENEDVTWFKVAQMASCFQYGHGTSC
jgi:hypothetical protein